MGEDKPEGRKFLNRDEQPEEVMFPDRTATHRNPIVLLGAIATAGVLVGGLTAFRAGNQQVAQKMMRTRVLFQGVTVAFMVGTSDAWSKLLVSTTSKDSAAGS